MDLSSLSDQEKESLFQFREEMKNDSLEDSSDSFLLRWLVAREFIVKKAAEMLRKSIEYRKIHKIQEMIETWVPPEVLQRYLTMTVFGIDKFHGPVQICLFGRCDIIGLFESVTVNDYVKYNIWCHERMRKDKKYCKPTGEPVFQETLIYDLECFSWRQMTCRHALEAGVECLKILEANSPESLRRVFVINTPRIFSFLYSLLKPLMQKRTLDKIRIYDFDATRWKAALLEEIDADQLPVHYGGTLTDPDGNTMCASKICMGGKVPKSYYLKKTKPKPRDNMENVFIHKGERKNIEFQIESPGSILRWEFMTEEGDLGFRLYRLNRGAETDIIPSDRVDCNITIEEGLYECIETGKYVVEFDNSYSYFRSKTVWFLFSVEKPLNAEP